MRIHRGSEAKPGVESVEIEGYGSYNFVEGEADVSDEVGQLLISLGVAKPMDIVRVSVPVSRADLGAQVTKVEPPPELAAPPASSDAAPAGQPAEDE